MEEEWNLVENEQNETPSVEKSQSTSLTLNFNRFEQLEEKRQQLLQDEPLSPIPQQYTEQEGLSSPVNSHSSDGSNWMNNVALFDNNDTTATDIENELDLETPPSFLFSTQITMLPQDEQQDTLDQTRESVADQSTKWSSSVGSSVPYLSELPPSSSKEETAPEPAKSIAPFSIFKNEQQLASSSSSSPQSSASAAVEPESQDILPATKKWKPNPTPRLTEHRLEAFTNSSSSTDEVDEESNTNDNDEENGSTSQANNQRLSPRERMNNSLRFSQDQDQSLARLFVDLEQKNPSLAWSKLSELDLRRQNLSVLQDIKSCFPVLRRLRVSQNALTMITGLPSTLNILEASNNRLTELNLDYPCNLHSINISHNLIDNIDSFSDLHCLRTLDMSYNNIKSCEPFGNFVSLLWLSLKGNNIKRLFFDQHEEYCLEYLDVSHNRIEILNRIESLAHLQELELAHNNIKLVSLGCPLERLYRLVLSYNRLRSFDASFFPELAMLYLDDNSIQHLIGLNTITRLESFSIRDQGVQKVDYNVRHLRGTRKLYLSGSSFSQSDHMIDFYSLQYLELCSAGLEQLPARFAKYVPNLTVLDLSMNRLSDIRPLRKLKYIQRLTVIGNQLTSLSDVTKTVKHFKKMKYLDLRNNPITSHFYSKALLPASGHAAKSYVAIIQDNQWLKEDDSFSMSMEKHWRERRNIYRALLIKDCSYLVELDHIPIEPQERDQSHLIVEDYINLFNTTENTFVE